MHSRCASLTRLKKCSSQLSPVTVNNCVEFFSSAVPSTKKIQFTVIKKTPQKSSSSGQEDTSSTQLNTGPSASSASDTTQKLEDKALTEKKTHVKVCKLKLQMQKGGPIEYIPKEVHERLFQGIDYSNCNGVFQKAHSVNRSFIPMMRNIFGKLKLGQPYPQTQKPKTVSDHFDTISREQSSYCKQLLDLLASKMDEKKLFQCMPQEWLNQPGWTKYDMNTGAPSAIDYPDSEVLVFDVECCITVSNAPTMAIALGENGWYSWCSDTFCDSDRTRFDPLVTLKDVIPLGFGVSDGDRVVPRIVVGHSVGFDRSKVREQYLLNPRAKTKFWDTMSMHIAICGLTTEQQNRMRMMTKQSEIDRKEGNTPAKKKKLKQWHDDMVEMTSLNNLRDVHALHCPHSPLQTLDKSQRDILITGSLDDVRNEFQPVMKYCAFDVFATFEVFRALWDEFRTRFPHPATVAGMLCMSSAYLPVNENWLKYIGRADVAAESVEKELRELLMEQANNALQLLADKGYQSDPWLWDMDWKLAKKGDHIDLPKWFRDMCPKKADPNPDKRDPSKVTPRQKDSAKLLRMSWNGYPLVHLKNNGWGYLKPDEEKHQEDREKWPSPDGGDSFWLEFSFGEVSFPYKKIKEETDSKIHAEEVDEDKRKSKVDFYPGCFFYSLPHADGGKSNVGSPLSKSMQQRLDSGELTSRNLTHAKFISEKLSGTSYWTGNRARVKDQMPVWLTPPRDANSPPEAGIGVGAIVPQIAPAGTVTRRAVERCWLTSSNVSETRVGSELRAMVTAPPGYCFVGADVDSEEQWIGSILGDKYVIDEEHAVRSKHAGEPGVTLFSKTFLQGRKEVETDSHSITAKQLLITRKQAKILNYARLYGAGRKFAESLHTRWLPESQKNIAPVLIDGLYRRTKGRRLRLNPDEKTKWRDGSESAMFNYLEERAKGDLLSSPFLEAMAPKPIQLNKSDSFLKTRINWVVQSSGVDFLHLLLTSMEHFSAFADIDLRFVLSLHDDIRYMAKWEDRHRCALAFQLSHFLTRAFFCHKLGIHCIPKTIAFFEKVNIDRVLRSNPKDEYITPSNPLGLTETYGIPPGESLSMDDILKQTNGSLFPKSR